jgi:anti-sigma regulatory factor (Ser/Thr protein kinase)
VPKHALNTELVETVHNVLEVVRQERGHSRLMEFMTQNDCEFHLENDRTLIPPLVGYLQESVAKLGICEESEQMRVGIAVDEALVNALYHGNLEVSSELREADAEAYQLLVQQRLEQAPYCDRRIRVRAQLTTEQAVFTIRDQGRGFDPSILPDPTDPGNLERVSGRGILLMRTFMDEVAYNDVGNCVKLIKRRDPTAPPRHRPGSGTNGS